MATLVRFAFGVGVSGVGYLVLRDALWRRAEFGDAALTSARAGIPGLELAQQGERTPGAVPITRPALPLPTVGEAVSVVTQPFVLAWNASLAASRRGLHTAIASINATSARLAKGDAAQSEAPWWKGAVDMWTDAATAKGNPAHRDVDGVVTVTAPATAPSSNPTSAVDAVPASSDKPAWRKVVDTWAEAETAAGNPAHRYTDGAGARRLPAKTSSA